jgi:hypothetical protein
MAKRAPVSNQPSIFMKKTTITKARARTRDQFNDSMIAR